MPSATSRIKVTHDEWQNQVFHLAHMLGWHHLHVRRSIGKGRKWVTTTSRTGWPDGFFWHPERGFAAIEFKVGNDEVSDEQMQVLLELEQAGAKCMVAYPEDLDAVTAMLGGVRRG